MDALQRVGRVARDQLAGLDVARERHEADVGMRDEPLAGGHAVAGDDLQHARRDHVLRELDEAQQRERRLLGGFRICTLPAASAGPSFQTAIISG